MEDSESNSKRLLLSSHLRMESSITIFAILTHVSTTSVGHFDPTKIVYHLYGQTMVDKTVDRKLLARAVFVSDYSMRLR